MFIAPAYAAGAAAAPGLLEQMLPMAVILVFAYFLLIRPQQKKAKQTQEMLKALEKGDEVLTAGGLIGRVAKLSEVHVTLELADGVEILIQRAAITAKLEKGTIKNNI
jgi:preprotein translocase subunit YajC